MKYLLLLATLVLTASCESKEAKMIRLEQEKISACSAAERARALSQSMRDSPAYAAYNAANADWQANYKTDTARANRDLVLVDSINRASGMDTIVKASVEASSRCEVATREAESYLR